MLLFSGLALSADNSAMAATAVAHASNSYTVISYGGSLDEAKQRAIEICRSKGGVNVKIVAATPVFGYGAIAVGAKGTGSAVGIAVGRHSARDAESLAIEQCLKAGGVNPKITRHFRG